MRWMKRVQVLSAIVLVLVASVAAYSQVAAQGTTPGIRSKFRSGDTVVIPASETVPHDLYVVGGTVRVDGRIEGDLFVAGGTIDVTGPVDGDLFVGGGTVNIVGPVGRHLRVGGGNVSVAGPVKLDVLVGAGTLVVGSGSRIDGDLVFSAGQVTLDGNVAGGVLGQAQVYAKAGTVAGVEEVNLVQTQPTPTPAPTAGALVLSQVRRYVSVVMVGTLLLLLAPRLMGAAAARIRERPLPSLGVGVLGFVGFVPGLLALFVAMVLIAIPLGFLGLGRLVFVVVAGVLLSTASLGLLFTLLLMFVAAAVAGLSLGQLGTERAGMTSAMSPYVALAAGALAVVVVTAIPIVGWWLNAVIVLLSLGALLAVAWRSVRGRAAVSEPLGRGPAQAPSSSPLSPA